MRIAVDGRHLAGGRGVGRYSDVLLGALRQRFPGEEWRVVARGSRLAYASGAWLGRPRLDVSAGGADVAWLPAPAPCAVSRGTPYVVTVHDLSWVERPGDFTAYERLWHSAGRLRRLVRDATRVICVSAATADTLVSRAWADEERVRIVRSGPGFGATPDETRDNDEFRRRVPYFLVVGALEPRKGVETAVAAFRAARARGLRAELRFAGRGRVAVGGDGVHQHPSPPDDELGRLYAGALAVLHPALLEGFGFPPVEGLLHGVPAIVSDLPVYDETIGAGGLRVAPGDADALADAMLRVERDAGLRARIAHEGRAAIESLSWERAAEESHAVLVEAARG